MSARQTFDHLLGRFASGLGSAPLGLRGQGVCRFKYGERTEIALEVPDDASDHVYLSAIVISLAGHDPTTLAVIYERLLRLNAFLPMLGGASVAQIDMPRAADGASTLIQVRG